jgi:hypothetical protein
MLIPAERLRHLPKHVRLAHEYCFFLHDEVVRMLVEYEAAKATVVSFRFTDKAQSKRFDRLAKKHDALSAMRELGLHSEAKRVVMNNITMAMVSDCAHHLYEAFRCFEKRKVVPGFNLLRKPLLDNLMYFSWMVANEDAFYTAFTSGDPTRITQKMIGNHRRDTFAQAIDATDLGGMVTADDLIAMVFDVGNPNGLYRLFQHAVHLVTVERIEIKTSPENFNFIFRNPDDDDVYEALYAALPTVMLYLSHVIMALYERIKPMDPASRKAFIFRSTTAYRCLDSRDEAETVSKAMDDNLSPMIKCAACGAQLKITPYNAARLLLTDSFRCVRCRRKQIFPLSWTF